MSTSASHLEYRTTSTLAKAAIVLLPVAIMFSRSAAELAVVLVGMLFLFRSYRAGEWAWARQPWFLAALIFAIYLAGLSAPWAAHPDIAMTHSILFLRWPLFAAALAYWILPNPYMRRWFEIAIASIVLFIMADSLIQYISGTNLFGNPPDRPNRLTGPFNKSIAGTYTLRIFFIALAAIYFSRYMRNDLARNITLLLTLATGAAFTFLTGERVAFLSFLLASGFVLLVFIYNQQRGRLGIILGAVILGVGIAGILATQPKMVDRTLGSTISTIENFWESPYGKLYDNALSLWRDNPWTGIGVKNYRSVCTQVTQDPSIEGWFCSHPHNTYIEVLTEGGIFGLLIFCAMLALILWRLARALPHRTMHATFAIAVFLVSFWPVMSTMSIFSGWIAAIIWMGMGWALAVTQKQ